ncbi:MAG TPA: cyclase family protein, partial [Polyangiales bacterium]|nr:cyclase family protein [Polyangiales bacterium]
MLAAFQEAPMSEPRVLPKYRDLPAVPGMPAKTAWGLFGPNDELGMINLQTPERIARAAQLVKRGALFAMNWAQDLPNPPLFHRGALKHTVHRKVPIGHHSDDQLDNFFPQASSQWDALTHVGDFEHGFWGGVTVQELRDSPEHARQRLGIDHWARRGIAGRAVLIDVARDRARRGRPIDCAARDVIEIEDLESARTSQNVTFEPGDIWLIRTGWIGWYEAQPASVREALAAEPFRMKLPGLRCSEAMAEYIFDHHPSALAADNP